MVLERSGQQIIVFLQPNAVRVLVNELEVLHAVTSGQRHYKSATAHLQSERSVPAVANILCRQLVPVPALDAAAEMDRIHASVRGDLRSSIGKQGREAFAE